MSQDAFKKFIFIVCFIFSAFSMHSDMLGGYWGLNGTPFLLFRFFLVIVLMTVSVFINRSDIGFVERFVPVATPILTALIIFDYYVTNISGSHYLYRVWWTAYLIVTLMTVFLADTFISDEGYPLFYKRFWLSFTPLYIFVLYLCFLRAPGEVSNVNLVLGQGSFLMLKALINNIHVSFEAPLMFFGNIVIFTPLPFILSAISRKFNPVVIMIIGILTPFAVEGYQYIFKCGQVDIDDIVLNFAGFLMAFIAYLIIYKYKLNKKSVS